MFKTHTYNVEFYLSGGGNEILNHTKTNQVYCITILIVSFLFSKK
jgi:hypothetical protein